MHMQKVILKITAFFLCGLLIYNSLGYFMVLSVMRMAVRQQKWAQLSTIPDQQLTTFTFNKNNPGPGMKIVNKREIMVDGRLYDIVRKTDNGLQIRYYCVHDHQEETLIAKTRLFNSQAQQMPHQNEARHIIEKIIKTGIFTEEHSFVSESFHAVYSNFPEVNYSGPIIRISPPPPQSSC